MRKSVNFQFFIVPLCFLSLASCNDDDSKEPDGPDKLIVGTWLRTQFEYSNARTHGDWVLWSQPCQMDDTDEFTSDGKLIYNPGSVLCEGQTNVTEGGAYRLEDNGAKLILIFGNENSPRESPRDIEYIDRETLVITHNMGDSENSLIRTTYARY